MAIFWIVKREKEDTWLLDYLSVGFQWSKVLFLGLPFAGLNMFHFPNFQSCWYTPPPLNACQCTSSFLIIHAWFHNIAITLSLAFIFLAWLNSRLQLSLAFFPLTFSRYFCVRKTVTHLGYSISSVIWSSISRYSILIKPNLITNSSGFLVNYWNSLMIIAT